MHRRPTPATRRTSTSLVRALVLALFLALTGCASTQEQVLPQDGPTMRAIYEAHIERTGRTEPPALRARLGTRGPVEAPAWLPAATRTAVTELDTTFPRLPNPTLVLYVYPHLATGARVPVPGYVTTFPLYERTEYALPGEVPVASPPATGAPDHE